MSPSEPPEGLDVEVVIFLSPAVLDAEDTALTVPPQVKFVPSNVRFEDPPKLPELLNRA